MSSTQPRIFKTSPFHWELPENRDKCLPSQSGASPRSRKGFLQIRSCTLRAWPRQVHHQTEVLLDGVVPPSITPGVIPVRVYGVGKGSFLFETDVSQSQPRASHAPNAFLPPGSPAASHLQALRAALGGRAEDASALFQYGRPRLCDRPGHVDSLAYEVAGAWTAIVPSRAPSRVGDCPCQPEPERSWQRARAGSAWQRLRRQRQFGRGPARRSGGGAIFPYWPDGKTYPA